MNDLKKICSNCNKEKDITFFYKRSKKGGSYRSRCKECLYIIKIKGSKDFLETRNEYWKNRKVKSKERRRKTDYSKTDRARDTRLKNLYGINLDQYNNILKNQDGVCAICESTCSQHGKLLSVDHCHESGQVRGLLCDNCNKGLGIFKDNYFNLKKAAEYIRNNLKTDCYACDVFCGNKHCCNNPYKDIKNERKPKQKTCKDTGGCGCKQSKS